MKTIRKGNDITIRWTITRYGEPEDFTGKNYIVKLIDKNNCPQKFEYTIEGNVITGTFFGKDQHVNGVHRLLLIENCGEEGMVSLDYIDCFLISNKLKNTTSIGSDMSSTINTEVIDLSSNININGDLSDYATIDYVNQSIALVDSSIQNELSEKQDTLVSGENIKTINGYSILGSGNLEIGGSGVQIQSDWDQTNTTAVDYIKNKPDLSIYALDSSIPTKVSDLTNDSSFVTESDLQTDLSGYATTSDLTSKQDLLVSAENIKTINGYSLLGQGNIQIGSSGTQIQANWNEADPTDPAYIQNKPDLSIFALDSSIPTKTSDLVNDSSYITEAELESELNNYVTFADIPVNVSTFVNDASYITPTALANMFVYDASTNTLTLTIQ